MPPVLKQKPKKSSKKNEIVAANEEVISGQLQKKINKKQPTKDHRGVVFIKHLPHGFFEQQLKNYFEQFGKVTRMRLARSKKTGGSKGYAFVEFEYPEVAQVAAETMDNYLMFKKIVKAAYIPPEKQQYNYFKSSLRTVKNKSGKTVYVSSKTAALQRKVKKHNDWSDENFQKRTSQQMKKLKKLGKKCAHLGIDIDKIINGVDSLAKAPEEEVAGSSKNKKRKMEKEADKQKSSKKQPKLEDLLGNTLQEDSEDEDYTGDMHDESVEGELSSDEESYGFLKDEGSDDDEDEDDDDEEEEEEDEEEEIEMPAQKTKLKFSKSLKSSNIERFDQMLKRKPHTGGVQKINKKIPKTNTTSVSAKNKKQLLSQAKEFAKPLEKVKGKTGNIGKILKKHKKVK